MGAQGEQEVVAYGAFGKGLIVGSSDGLRTPVTLWGNASTHRLLVDALVSSSLVSAPLNGQAKIAATGTAVQLSSNALSNGVIVTAKSTNTANIHIGGSGVTNTEDGTGNGYILEPGSSASWAVTNTNALYINGTTGDIVSFAGS